MGAIGDSLKIGRPAFVCSSCGETTHVYCAVSVAGKMERVLPCFVGCSCDTAYEEQQKLMRRKKIIEKAFALSTIPGSIDDYSFDNAQKRNDRLLMFVEKYCTSMQVNFDAGIGFVLSGPCGIGKTYMLYCIVNSAADLSVQPLYVTHEELLDSYRQSFNSKEAMSKEYISTLLRSAKVLIVDEFCMVEKKDWIIEKTFDVIDLFYRARKPIIVATNLNKNALSRYFVDTRYGFDRVTPRLFERSPFLTCSTGKDYRKFLGKDMFDQLVGGIDDKCS